MKVYGKSIEEIVKEWNNYFEKTKIKLGPERKIIFKVVTGILPDSSKIYITGDNKLLGFWNPAAVEFEKQTEGSWIKEFHFPEGTVIKYKITRGRWDNEALDQNGNVPPNSVYEVKDDTTVILNINKWKDINK